MFTSLSYWIGVFGFFGVYFIGKKLLTKEKIECHENNHQAYLNFKSHLQERNDLLIANGYPGFNVEEEAECINYKY